MGLEAARHAVVIPMLLGVLRDDESETVREHAAEALGAMEKLGVRIFKGSVRWVKDLAGD